MLGQNIKVMQMNRYAGELDVMVRQMFTQKELLQLGYRTVNQSLMYKETVTGNVRLYFKNEEGLFEEMCNEHCAYVTLDLVVKGKC